MLSKRPFIVLLLLGMVLCSLPALAVEDHHTLVLVHTDSPAADQFIRDNQNQLDIVLVKPGHYVQIAAQPKALDLLRSAGLTMDILQEDMETHYASRSKGVGFGIFHTYSENVAFQDSLRLLYPNVISEKWSIGQSHEGRDIWCFRVSANPDIDEDEPEILIDGMHHAREIMASEFPIMFAEYLAQNYGTDPEITWLLDHRELYIVPIVNPDGVVYNESTNPNGGGMWRKNRRNNGDGSYGVDPNRNYPYMWGYDNSGSSPSPSSDTYRGPSAGSEPEVQALMGLINAHQFRTQDSVHTYSNLTLFPWGYIATDTPHGATFIHMAQEMTKYNGYAWGKPADLLYTVNGGTNDWAYGAQSEHDFIYSFTNEIGSSSDGFWPEESRRGSLFQENIWPHIYLMRVAGTFVTVHSPVTSSTSKSILPGESGVLDFSIENQSVVGVSSVVNLTLHCDDAFVQFTQATRNIGTISAMQTLTLGVDPIPFTVDAACPDGHLVNLTVTVHQAEGDQDFPLSFLVGSPASIFSDDFESGLSNWTTTGSWGSTSSQSHSPSNSLADSPSGNYSNQTATSATLNGSFQAATFSFWHKLDIENGYDFGRVQISADDGPWTTLVSYDGSQSSWQLVELDLDAYFGQDLRFRFLLETDYSVTEDGWFIDDVTITGAGTENGIPSIPVAVSPSAGSTESGSVTFTVANSSDPDGDAVSYGFRIYHDVLLTDLAGGADNVVEEPNQTTWSTTLNDGSYFWRAYAGDGTDRSLLSEAVAFSVEATSAAGGIFIGGPMMRVLNNVGSGNAKLEMMLPGSMDVQVAIYDARGARVRQIHSGGLQSGSTTLMWDGRDTQGRAAASGVYFVRAIIGQEALTGRVVVVR